MGWAALLSVGALTFPAIAIAQEGDSGERAEIHFADIGGIEDWRAEDSERLLIEGRNGTWYEATFFGHCNGLQFADSIAFVTDSAGHLDRFGSIWVDGERCWFRTLERIDPSEELEDEPLE